jgi:hypothetical protein
MLGEFPATLRVRLAGMMLCALRCSAVGSGGTYWVLQHPSCDGVCCCMTPCALARAHIAGFSGMRCLGGAEAAESFCMLYVGFRRCRGCGVSRWRLSPACTARLQSSCARFARRTCMSCMYQATLPLSLPALTHVCAGCDCLEAGRTAGWSVKESEELVTRRVGHTLQRHAACSNSQPRNHVRRE